MASCDQSKLNAPFTLSSTERVVFPAWLDALQVNVPLCLCPTEVIIRELPILPRGVVIMPRSDEISWPWKDQEMVRGWSPLVTMQDTWAKEPSSITSWPKLRGSKLGGSDGKTSLLFLTINH